MTPKGFDHTHCVSDAFLDHLDQLTRQEDASWWRDVLLHKGVFLAVRRNSLNVYHRGGSIFRIDDQGDGTARPKTHVKYLVRQQQALAELIDGQFESNVIGWTHYDSPETLRDMIRAASDLAGPEKAGLHPLLVGSPNVIDVEISLERAGEADSIDPGATAGDPNSGIETSRLAPRRNQDRIDVATLETQGDSVAVVFHEAKHFTNPALRAKGGEPAVIGQIRRYRRTVAHHAPSLLERYQATCRALIRLDAMRRQVRSTDDAPEPPKLYQLISDVAAGKAKLTIDTNPRLVIFGFDADQKNGMLQSILDTLRRTEPAFPIYAAGDPATATGAFRPPVAPKS